MSKYKPQTLYVYLLRDYNYHHGYNHMSDKYLTLALYTIDKYVCIYLLRIVGFQDKTCLPNE